MNPIFACQTASSSPGGLNAQPALLKAGTHSGLLGFFGVLGARPTPEALAIDVFSTVRQIGYPIRVVQGYDDEMNRYAFLMVE